MSTTHSHPCLTCTCQSAHVDDAVRRSVIKIVAVGLAVPLSLAPALAQTGPVVGDRLVEDDAEGTPSPLRPADVQLGKPLLAFPFDKAAGKARSESRLSKVVLMRFAEADLDAETRARAAAGVVAFSAICTHQACEVKTWLPKEKALVCYCHSSKFDLLGGGKVISGPAPRPLAFLPLTLEGDQLAVAGPFSGALGGAA